MIVRWISDPAAFDEHPAANGVFHEVVAELLHYLVLYDYPTAIGIDLHVHRGATQWLGPRRPDRRPWMSESSRPPP